MRLSLLIPLLFALVATACPPRATVATDPSVKTVAFDEATTLSPGETVLVADHAGSLKFLEVKNDSRCPKGVNCIQAGEASVLVELADGIKQTVEIGAQYRDVQRVATGDVVVHLLRLDPYPEEKKRIGEGGYRLHVKVLPQGR